MNNELEILQEIRNNLGNIIGLSGLGIKVLPWPNDENIWHPDFLVEVSYKDHHFRIVGEISIQKSFSVFKDKVAQLRSYNSQYRNVIPMIMAPYLSPKRRMICLEMGICYFDLSGNILLSYESIYIERSGFPNRFPEQRRGRGPFSDKASLILRLLLSQKKKNWGIRELAGDVNLNPGFVSRMMSELERRNYIIRENRRIRLINPKNILEDWVHEYDYRKNKAYSYFCLAKESEEVIDRIRGVDSRVNVNYALSLQAGANLVSPFSVYNEIHIYVPGSDSINFFIEKLKLKEVEQGANLNFLIPYYKHSVFYSKQKIKGLWVVSNLQLYIDLYKYPIRGLEQAEHLYDKVLENEIEVKI